MENVKISVICVYNKRDVFTNILKKSLAEQSIPYELIAVDNTKGKYKSAASALNYGALNATGSILVFVHQDVSFDTPNTLYELASTFYENSTTGDIGGVVGAAFDMRKQPHIVAGSKVNFLGEKVGEKGFSKEFEYAESIDELLVIMSINTFKLHQFDEITCNGWHFYAIEQCLYARTKDNKVIVINADVTHLSRGYIDSKFYWMQYKIARKYYWVDRIIGTCCDFTPKPLYGHLYVAIRASLKEIFKRKKLNYK